MTRKEYEYEIPLEDGIEILNAFTKRGTEKIRYCVPFAGQTWEVDVFLADNTGLIVAEIELQSETELFEKPDWVTTEVPMRAGTIIPVCQTILIKIGKV